MMDNHNERTTLRTRTWAVVACALLAVGGTSPRVLANDGNAKGVVYVESNDPNGNAILAYQRHADGSLTPLSGSPFPTGGTGISPSFSLGPFDSDQEIIANPSKTLLFAVNGGSDTIAVFKIGAGGALAPVAGSPFPSGGSNPVSLGLAGDILCVVNKDEDPGHPGQFLPNYTTFRVNLAGRLTPIPHSTVYDEIGSDPSQALVAPGGNLIFGADFLGGALRSFAIGASGRLLPRALLPLPPSEFAGTGSPPLPLGLAAHPDHPLLYVGFVTISRVGVYRYNGSGALQFLRSVAESGHGVCWLLVNKSGTRLYASNTGDPSVSVFDLTQNPAEPVEIQKVNLHVVAGSNPGGFQFALDPTGRFLHVVSQQSSATSTVAANALHVFSVDEDGKLTEVPSSPTLLPVPNMTRPQGVVAF
jgi:6-phosphogluconolactonase (cycloisomerase 2 family)